MQLELFTDNDLRGDLLHQAMSYIYTHVNRKDNNKHANRMTKLFYDVIEKTNDKRSMDMETFTTMAETKYNDSKEFENDYNAINDVIENYKENNEK
jgi:hypothetical protein